MIDIISISISIICWVGLFVFTAYKYSSPNVTNTNIVLLNTILLISGLVIAVVAFGSCGW